MSDFHFEHVELASGARLGSTCWDATDEVRRRDARGIGLLIGEAPAGSTKSAQRPGEPLTHDSLVGKRLIGLMSLSTKSYYHLFDRVNLLPEQRRHKSSWFGNNGYEFDLVLAEKSAREVVDDVIIPRRYSMVFMLGARVHRAFSAALGDASLKSAGWYDTVRVSGMVDSPLVAIPHPSGTSRTWNDPAAVERCRCELISLLSAMRFP